ncbi:hypothetical protein Sjap_005008 [Stephania japonica]|uniref:Uncharacterized protein n=1 Tax=Stephania japonica TaxID=461633 RepID=A0AAP0PKR1_9MAGN
MREAHSWRIQYVNRECQAVEENVKDQGPSKAPFLHLDMSSECFSFEALVMEM